MKKRKKKEKHSVAKEKHSVASTTYQVNHSGLSYFAQHLMLLIQHYVDIKDIKVPSDDISWDTLVGVNQKIDLENKKERAKKFCSIIKLSKEEINDLDTIAIRVTEFVAEHQPENVIKS